MRKEHTPEHTTAARTNYQFTKDDVAAALVLWVAAKGGIVPAGTRDLFLRPEQGCCDWFVALRVDHDESKTGVEK